jgi:hypothetical protein
MMPRSYTIIKAAVWMTLVLAAAIYPCAAESLYEYYTSATPESLQAETQTMGQQLARVFNEDSVGRRQQQIDFSEYHSNLKKAVLYAGKLATYGEYDKDLRFARDNEIFKGLPDGDALHSKKESAAEKRQFAEKKYKSMTKNVQEEIDTYQDLIHMALDACEMLTSNDLSGMLENTNFREKLDEYQQSSDFQEFEDKRALLSRKWPEVEKRLGIQLRLWQEPPPSPDEPIISPKITGDIAHATVVHSTKW